MKIRKNTVRKVAERLLNTDDPLEVLAIEARYGPKIMRHVNAYLECVCKQPWVVGLIRECSLLRPKKKRKGRKSKKWRIA